MRSGIDITSTVRGPRTNTAIIITTARHTNETADHHLVMVLPLATTTSTTTTARVTTTASTTTTLPHEHATTTSISRKARAITVSTTMTAFEQIEPAERRTKVTDERRRQPTLCFNHLLLGNLPFTPLALAGDITPARKRPKAVITGKNLDTKTVPPLPIRRLPVTVTARRIIFPQLKKVPVIVTPTPIIVRLLVGQRALRAQVPEPSRREEVRMRIRAVRTATMTKVSAAGTMTMPRRLPPGTAIGRRKRPKMPRLEAPTAVATSRSTTPMARDQRTSPTTLM